MISGRFGDHGPVGTIDLQPERRAGPTFDTAGRQRAAGDLVRHDKTLLVQAKPIAGLTAL